METSAGYSGTPLIRKLGLEPGMRVRLLEPPDEYWELLGGTPDTIGVERLPANGEQRADFTHLFATDSRTLEEAFVQARAGMQVDGMVWASWPKKSSGVPSEIGKSDIMAAGQEVGLVDIKVCAVDETWSGLKFVIPVEDRDTTHTR